MALKNSTKFKVTTRDLTDATDPRIFGTDHPDSAKEVKTVVNFCGIKDNKILLTLEVFMKIGEHEVLLKGDPEISLNHFELELTGESAKLTPEEKIKIQQRIASLQAKLEAGVAVSDIDNDE